jgi:hypothetical protein
MNARQGFMNRHLAVLLVLAGLFPGGGGAWAQETPAGEEAAGGEEGKVKDKEAGEETGIVAEDAVVEEEEAQPVTMDVEAPPAKAVMTVQPELAPFPLEEEEEEAAGAGGGEKGKAPEGEEKPGIQLDAQVVTTPASTRFWQINGIIELHTNLVSDDYSANDAYMQYYLRGNFDVTKNNRLSLRMDLAQEFLADKGETGMWFGDMRFYYTRKFVLKTWKDYVIPGMVYFYLTAPTSRASIARSIITKPTVVLALAPSVGPVTFIGRGVLQYVFAKYAQSRESDPNPQFSAGYDLQMVISTPLDWLVFSGDWSYTWTKDYRSREGHQSMWFAEYYWEAAVTFVIPMPKKAPSFDITLAYAQGASVLEDGVYRTYFVKRDQSEMYLSLNLVY